MVEDIEKKAELLKKEVGKRVREARKSAGFSNADSAAADLEVSATTLYELERGENWLSPEVAVRIHERWGIPPTRLFGEPSQSLPNPQQALEVLANLVNSKPPAALPGTEDFDDSEMGMLNAAVEAIRSQREFSSTRKKRENHS